MRYLDLFHALSTHQVRYVLVGGLAMNLHGVPRMTMDIDLILAMDDANLDHFIRCAEALELRPVAPVKLADLKDPALRQQWITQKHMIAFGLQGEHNHLMVDILIAPKINLDQALQRAERRPVGDTEVVLASIDDMIALKAHTGRQQDQSDIEHLERIRDH